jgi:hypothetical protein
MNKKRRKTNLDQAKNKIVRLTTTQQHNKLNKKEITAQRHTFAKSVFKGDNKCFFCISTNKKHIHAKPASRHISDNHHTEKRDKKKKKKRKTSPRQNSAQNQTHTLKTSEVKS